MKKKYINFSDRVRLRYCISEKSIECINEYYSDKIKELIAEARDEFFFRTYSAR